MHFVGLFLSSLLKMHGPKNQILLGYFIFLKSRTIHRAHLLLRQLLILFNFFFHFICVFDVPGSNLNLGRAFLTILPRYYPIPSTFVTQKCPITLLCVTTPSLLHFIFILPQNLSLFLSNQTHRFTSCVTIGFLRTIFFWVLQFLILNADVLRGINRVQWIFDVFWLRDEPPI